MNSFAHIHKITLSCLFTVRKTEDSASLSLFWYVRIKKQVLLIKEFIERGPIINSSMGHFSM